MNRVRKHFTLIIPTESRQTDESKFFQKINGYKSHTINRLGRKGEGIKKIHLDFITTEVISQLIMKPFLSSYIRLR